MPVLIYAFPMLHRENIYTWRLMLMELICMPQLLCFIRWKLMLMEGILVHHLQRTGTGMDGRAPRQNFVINVLAFAGNAYRKILLTVFRNILAASHGKIFESGLWCIGYPDVVESAKFENYNILCIWLCVDINKGQNIICFLCYIYYFEIIFIARSNARAWT